MNRGCAARLSPRHIMLVIVVLLGLTFAPAWIAVVDVFVQTVLTGIQHLVGLAVAMMIAPGQAESASALVLVAALGVGAALAGVFVWHIRRRRAEYG